MHKEFIMGNEAIALGALASGVNVISGYPGTPSTEVLETAAKKAEQDVYIEWSCNEKVAMELAAGAAYSGARALVTMKQVGLNVASDPLMSLEYVGVKGAMVVMVADDPGPISSQTEQDTRTFAYFSKLPCFDPSTAEEAYWMIQEAFEYSEKYNTPVFFRPTTRVCHGYASIDVLDKNEYKKNIPEGFVKDSKRWVIFPRLSYNNHIKIVERNEKLSDAFSDYERNFVIDNNCKKGVATHGFNFTYVKEALTDSLKFDVLKISTPHPFPEKIAKEFLEKHDEVLCIEELDPVIEKELIFICGKYNIKTKIFGKLTHDVKTAGENTCQSVYDNILDFLGAERQAHKELPNAPELPVRPPVLCAGCPHRASFLAVKEAMKGKKSVFCGDIGCYTLGNAMPLDMVDTCLCMGAGINIAQGIGKIEPDTKCFAFVGDSTFFASAITGIVNAVYNRADMTLIVLDNSTTAMTGHQPHPGTGFTPRGDVAGTVNIQKVLEGIGVSNIRTVNPLELGTAINTVKEMAEIKGVKAIIFKSPCIAVTKPQKAYVVDNNKCIGCKACINKVGCPAISCVDNKAVIEPSMCTGCRLCSQVCPVSAIVK